MLVIRKEQVAALAKLRAATLPARVAGYLASVEPRRTAALGPAGLDAFVRAALERARSHDMAIEWDACRFCLLALHHGAEFDALPWAQEILADATSPSERMAQLEQHHLDYLA
jgi:hypothetical protein